MENALEDQLIIPFPKPLRPLKLTQPGHEPAIGLELANRGPEEVQTEAEGGTGRDHLIQPPVQPFLNQPRHRQCFLARSPWHDKVKGVVPHIGFAVPPLQVRAQGQGLPRRPIDRMGQRDAIAPQSAVMPAARTGPRSPTFWLCSALLWKYHQGPLSLQPAAYGLPHPVDALPLPLPVTRLKTRYEMGWVGPFSVALSATSETAPRGAPTN